MSFLATWTPDKERLRAFFDHLLAELESPLALIDVARRWTSPGRTCIEALAVYYYPGTWAGNLASPIRPQASSLVMSVPAGLGRTQQARL